MKYHHDNKKNLTSVKYERKYAPSFINGMYTLWQALDFYTQQAKRNMAHACSSAGFRKGRVEGKERLWSWMRFSKERFRR
jgi:hypothetical protein